VICTYLSILVFGERVVVRRGGESGIDGRLTAVPRGWRIQSEIGPDVEAPTRLGAVFAFIQQIGGEK